MAKSVDDIVKEQLGQLMLRLAVLTAELEAAQEEIAKYKAAKPAAKAKE